MSKLKQWCNEKYDFIINEGNARGYNGYQNYDSLKQKQIFYFQ